MRCQHHIHITQEARMCNPPWPHRWCCHCGHVEDASRNPVELPPREQVYEADCGPWREVRAKGIVCVK